MKPLYTKEQFENAKPNEKLQLECYYCKSIFYSIPKEIRKVLNRHTRIKLKYCSKKCSGLDKRTIQKINCKNCNKEFLKFPNEIKKSKSGNHFCSKSCSATYNNKNKTSGTRRSKLEIWLESKLIQLYPGLKFEFNDVKTINAELDIFIPSLNLAFELNGIFHYEPIYGKEKLEKTQNNDNRKFQACLEKEIELCIVDTTQMSYFKESSAQKYLDIIIKIINQKNKYVKEL